MLNITFEFGFFPSNIIVTVSKFATRTKAGNFEKYKLIERYLNIIDGNCLIIDGRLINLLQRKFFN